MKNLHRSLRVLTVSSLACGGLAWANEAGAAETTRRGLQIEGMVGGSACIPGRAACHQNTLLIDGGTHPSFGVGAAIGFRPVKWFMVGGMYRYGMLNPSYRLDTGPAYSSAGQHTWAVMFRPILPLWRMDLGFNIAPGFGRQVFRMSHGNDRDLSQGFSMLIGPTIDFYVTKHFFLGAEVDFIFNTQKKVCERRDSNTTCTTQPTRKIAPVHQVLFGLHLGATFG